jgi:hypothetical protein
MTILMLGLAMGDRVGGVVGTGAGGGRLAEASSGWKPSIVRREERKWRGMGGLYALSL